MNGLVILSAFLLDLVLGDPRWLPHPVRAIGQLIVWQEAMYRKRAGSKAAETAAGVALVIVTVSVVYFTARLIVLAATHLSPWAGFVVSAVLASTTIAARGLADAARAVRDRLDTGDLASARGELAMIVGRDTARLDEGEISRAVIETVAENASDGIVAPLFYLAIGGPALALAYKAVNTLDSMVGYKNERYRHFGWAAARLDDIANFIPARITAILICLATAVQRRMKPAATAFTSLFTTNSERSLTSNASIGGTPNSELFSPWRIMLRDGRNHPSPNSGYPEAAMAGALGVRLGGPSSYGGQPGVKPFIGDAKFPIDKKYIEKSVRLMYSANLLAACGAASIRFFL
ncbi:MAG: adenosylcobinamide-phosphate synthase CbiB [Nitrospirota bacterium]